MGQVEFDVTHNFTKVSDTLCGREHLLAIWVDGKVLKVTSFTLDFESE